MKPTVEIDKIQLTIVFSLTALIFFVTANFFPFMHMEMYGRSNDATIWSGIVSLANSGSLFLALVVFMASLLIPFLKILSLFYLGLARSQNLTGFQKNLFAFIEVIGPWSMLDVFLLAVFVAIIKFDSLATVRAGIGSVFFTLVVIFTMAASASYKRYEKDLKND